MACIGISSSSSTLPGLQNQTMYACLMQDMFKQAAEAAARGDYTAAAAGRFDER